MLHYTDLKFSLKANKSTNERASWNIFYAMVKEFNDYYMIKASGDGLINYTKLLLQDYEKSMKSPQPNNSMSCLNNGVECLSTALYHSIINPHNNHLQWEKKKTATLPCLCNPGKSTCWTHAGNDVREQNDHPKQRCHSQEQ